MKDASIKSPFGCYFGVFLPLFMESGYFYFIFLHRDSVVKGFPVFVKESTDISRQPALVCAMFFRT